MSAKLFINALITIVGKNHVHTSADEKIIASTPYRDGTGQTNFLAIIDPANVAEIAKVVQYCAQHHIAIIPQGGLTSLTKASIPTPNSIEPRLQIILRMARMNKIQDVIRDQSGMISAMRTQPGITLNTLNEKLRPYGVRVPIGLGIGFKAQIGGIVSTNAGGTEAAFKGRPDTLVLGLEVITADGKIWNLPSSEVAAPTMADFIGQEGTMGIITSIVISVIPISAQRKVIFVETDTIQNMYALLVKLKKEAGQYLNAFERIDASILALACRYFNMPDPFLNRRRGKNPADYNIVIELDSNDASLDLQRLAEQLIEQAKIKNYIQTAWIGASESEAEEIWSYRNVKLSEALKQRAKKINGRTIAFDIGVPEGDHAAFPSPALEKKLHALIPQIELYSFGHAAGGGQGGSLLHYDMIVPKNTTEEQIHLLKKTVYDEISQRKGNINAEHGIGFYKQADFKKYNPQTYSERISRKARLDPNNIFNPGKVLAIEDVKSYVKQQ